jgi:hypothetical protein
LPERFYDVFAFCFNQSAICGPCLLMVIAAERDAQIWAGCHDHGPLNKILEFPDIARPMVGFQQINVTV